MNLVWRYPNINPIKLSLCIATLNRAKYLGQTLDALLTQINPHVEIVVVDGASQDETSVLMERYIARCSAIAYYREPVNSGVDADFDKAVQYAKGDYCWLISDDDILEPFAVNYVIKCLEKMPDLIIANASIYDRSLFYQLKARQLEIKIDCEIGPFQHEAFFAQAGYYLSYIGCVIVRRDWWLQRERFSYYGSLFIHMGVIFQEPAPNRVVIIAQPLIRIRYGNAQWNSRAFDIWMRMWPELVWSFGQFSERVRRKVSPPKPAASLKTLLWFRGIGSCSIAELTQLSGKGVKVHRLGWLVARIPVRLINAALGLYCYLSIGKNARIKLYDIAVAKSASAISISLARRSRFPEMGR